ncbi:MAG: hypothetical protein HRT57_11575 [Crocinitomicaceae bacterium]|nr:hypothetical protein [Crocinitomicaceae bacterium]
MRIEGLNKWSLSIAFALKALIGVYFLFIYTEFYGDGALSADAGEFMEESRILNQVFWESPLDYIKFLTGVGDNTELQHQYLLETHHWDAGAQALINDNKNILRLHSLFHFASSGYPMIHVLFMCLISIVGTRHLIIGVSSKTDLNKNLILWAFILIPSVLFWTSGILKEPMMLLGVGLLARGLLDNKSRLKKRTYIFLGTIVLLGFKPYVIFALIPTFIFIGFYKILPKFKIIGALLLLVIITSSSLLIFSKKREQMVHLITRKQQDFKNIGKGGIFAWNGDGFYYFEPSQFPDLIVKNNQVILKKPLKATIIDHGGFESPIPILIPKDGTEWPIYFKRDQSRGYIEIAQIDDSFSQLMMNIPGAIRNCLLRPYINDPGSWLKYPALLEGWLVFLFIFYAIFKRLKITKELKLIIVSLLLFIFTLAIIIGLTTPVLGAIVRYRIPITIAIVIIGIIIINPHFKRKAKA